MTSFLLRGLRVTRPLIVSSSSSISSLLSSSSSSSSSLQFVRFVGTEKFVQKHSPTLANALKEHPGHTNKTSVTAMEYINSVPPIEVDGTIAVCDGGDPGMGHPIEYIQLNKVRGGSETCKYCGLRYVQKHHHH